MFGFFNGVPHLLSYIHTLSVQYYTNKKKPFDLQQQRIYSVFPIRLVSE